MIGVVDTKMAKTAEKLRKIEVELAAKKGPFTLFALIERDDSWGNWDVVVAADWVANNVKSTVETIASEIKKKLSREEQLMISRILVLDPSDNLVQNLNMIRAEHGLIRLTNNTYNGVSMKEVYLITSQPGGRAS